MSLQTERCLADLPDSEAALLLAKQAVFARQMKQMRKQAAPAFLQSILDTVKDNPTAAAGLAGAGIGAGIGGFSGLSGDEEKRKHWLRNMLTGAAAGGAVGGGGAFAAQQFMNRGSGGSSGGSGGGAIAPVVDPRKVTPDVLKRLDELQTQSPSEKVLSTGAKALWAYPSNYPLLGAAALADASGAGLRHAERAFNRNMPQVTLDADSIYDAAQRGKLDRFFKEPKKQPGGGSAPKPQAGARTDMLKDLTSTNSGGGVLTKDQLQSALATARATGKDVYLPGFGVMTPKDLAELSQASGGRVTTGAGTLQRLISYLSGGKSGPADNLAFTGYKAVQDPNAAAAFRAAKPYLASRLNPAQAGSDAELVDLIRKLKRNDFANLQRNVRASGAARATSRVLRDVYRGNLTGATSIQPADLWALRPGNSRVDKLLNQLSQRGGGAMRWWHSGKPGQFFNRQIPHAGLLGRAGLYAGVPLAMHTAKTLWQGGQRERELRDLVKQLTTPSGD